VTDWGALAAAALLDPVDFARCVYSFEPDAQQASILSSGAKRLLLCCSRQWGKSTTAAALIANRAVAEPECLVLCVAPTLRQSGELLRKVSGLLTQAGIPFVSRDKERLLENGSRVLAIPGTEANVRGFSAPSLIVIDEAARVSDSLYAAVRPMLVVGNGDLALLSTPFGERGFFWREWSEGEEWMRVEVKATDCPRIHQEVLEEERRKHGSEWFAQEYLCSFVGMENAAFRQEWLATAVREGLGVKALGFAFRGGTLQ